METTYPNKADFNEDFEMQSMVLLGQGTFGKVYKARAVRNLPRGEYALKIIETNHEKAYDLAIQELKLNHAINNHDNVVRIFKVYSWIEAEMQTKYILVLVMELALCSLKSDIDDKKKAKSRFDDSLIKDVMTQCLKAFYYLADKKCLYHRDIKPENLLVCSKNPYTVKIADFGAGRENSNAQHMLFTLVGTPLFLSPKLQVAYSTNAEGKVNHNLEKSDVFSLGLTFLQFILLLSDRDLMKLNDPLIYDQNTGNPIDCSDDPHLLNVCPGWKKLQSFVGMIQDPLIKACIYGMTHFSEGIRFTWWQALKTLIPETPDEPGEEDMVPQQKQFHQKQRALQTYSEAGIQARYMAVVNDLLPHRKILPAGNQFLTYSNDGVRVITLTGMAQQVYSQNVLFLVYMTWMNIAAGINRNYEIFAINLKTKQYVDEKITNFAANRVRVMKYMRRDLCAFGNSQGEVFILSFDQKSPQVCTRYREVDSAVVDLIYEDENKLILSCHENKLLYCKQITNPQSISFQTENVLNNLQLIDSMHFAALEQGTSYVDVFKIKDLTFSLMFRISNPKNVLPQSLTLCGSYLVWVSDANLGLINIEQKLRDNGGPDFLQTIQTPAGHAVCLNDEQIVALSDGMKVYFYTINKANSQQKTACKNCHIQ